MTTEARKTHSHKYYKKMQNCDINKYCLGLCFTDDDTDGLMSAALWKWHWLEKAWPQNNLLVFPCMDALSDDDIAKINNRLHDVEVVIRKGDCLHIEVGIFDWLCDVDLIMSHFEAIARVLENVDATKVAMNILVADHHNQSFQAAMELQSALNRHELINQRIDNIRFEPLINTARSACGILLDYYRPNPHGNLAKAASIANDYDTWQHKTAPLSFHLNAFLLMPGYSFQERCELALNVASNNTLTMALYETGKALHNKTMEHVRLAVGTTHIMQIKLSDPKMEVLVPAIYHSEGKVFASMLGNELCAKFNTSMAIVYYADLDKNAWKFSIRSTENSRLSAGTLATALSGGGHDNAAGCYVKWEKDNAFGWPEGFKLINMDNSTLERFTTRPAECEYLFPVIN